jgi:hypothetical protein
VLTKVDQINYKLILKQKSLNRFGAAISRVRYPQFPSKYTQASPNPNGLNPNITVGRNSVGI